MYVLSWAPTYVFPFLSIYASLLMLDMYIRPVGLSLVKTSSMCGLANDAISSINAVDRSWINSILGHISKSIQRTSSNTN